MGNTKKERVPPAHVAPGCRKRKKKRGGVETNFFFRRPSRLRKGAPGSRTSTTAWEKKGQEVAAVHPSPGEGTFEPTAGKRARGRSRPQLRQKTRTLQPRDESSDLLGEESERFAARKRGEKKKKKKTRSRRGRRRTTGGRNFLTATPNLAQTPPNLG